MSPATKLSPAATPQQSTAAFAQAINLGDLDAAGHCFAKDACLLTPDATAIRGRDEIRPDPRPADRSPVADRGSGKLDPARR